jgi:hypothetical protein
MQLSLLLTIPEEFHQVATVLTVLAQAKEVGGQAGDAVEQGANTAADKTEEAGSAAEDYSKTGQKQVGPPAVSACRTMATDVPFT